MTFVVLVDVLVVVSVVLVPHSNASTTSIDDLTTVSVSSCTSMFDCIVVASNGYTIVPAGHGPVTTIFKVICEVYNIILNAFQAMPAGGTITVSTRTDEGRFRISIADTGAGILKRLRDEGLKVGLLRPVSLWPFPSGAIRELAKKTKYFFVFEMNMGQMVEDVRIALEGAAEVHFYGRQGGVIPIPLEITRVISSQYYQKRLK